ncbi:helix-turn-helix domain-containing protein [Facklamia lactis]|uniref:helix-turn-helix domain-containing protein n=1 Tax=Facklamia lactis TaxID=2749967 RepID=UPI0018CF148A|nr:helix-turn-helix transcriptional regulator [Facklamia lactis]MBG9979463.1 helix-turn-helix transcriptional regulator [Facklamia lactis]
MELGPIIEHIRQQKNLKINDLIEGIISRTTYYRFVNNQSRISTITFMQIINRMNLHLDDLLDYITPDIDLEKGEDSFFVITYGTSCLKAYSVEELQNERKRFINMANSDPYYLHIRWLITFRLIEMGQEELSEETFIEIKAYLNNTPEWYFYEFYLVKNIIKYLDLSFLLSTYERVKKYLKIYQFDVKFFCLFDLIAEIYFFCICRGYPINLEEFEVLINEQTRTYTLLKYRILLKFYRILSSIDDIKTKGATIQLQIEDCYFLGLETLGDEMKKKFAEYCQFQ